MTDIKLDMMLLFKVSYAGSKESTAQEPEGRRVSTLTKTHAK